MLHANSLHISRAVSIFMEQNVTFVFGPVGSTATFEGYFDLKWVQCNLKFWDIKFSDNLWLSDYFKTTIFHFTAQKHSI